MLLHDLAARLLPSPLQVETLTLEDQGLTLDVKVPTPTAPCPTCAQPATRIHSDDRRTLADLPWATLPVSLSLQVRRFFCDTPSCDRQTFTERVPTVAAIREIGTRSARSTMIRPRRAIPAGMVVDRCHASSVWRSSSVRRIVREVRRPRGIPIPRNKGDMTPGIGSMVWGLDG